MRNETHFVCSKSVPNKHLSILKWNGNSNYVNWFNKNIKQCFHQNKVTKNETSFSFCFTNSSSLLGTVLHIWWMVQQQQQQQSAQLIIITNGRKSICFHQSSLLFNKFISANFLHYNFVHNNKRSGIFRSDRCKYQRWNVNKENGDCYWYLHTTLQTI